VLFDIKNLKVKFTVSNKSLYAVKDVSFHINKGEIIGIVGESGSGKSVTALSMLNLLPKNSSVEGDILYNDKSIFKLNKNELQSYRGGSVGIIFQEPGRSFDPIYSIGKTIRETILTHNKDLTEKQIYQKSIQLLKEVHIPNPEERLKNFPHQFSGGLLQRIMIGLALATDPEVLIADEPTTALDVTIQSQIVNLLLEIRKKRNIAIIFISHNLALIGNIADRIIVMYSGMILEEGMAQEVINFPHHPYTKGLIDSLPKFGEHYSKDKLRTICGNIPSPFDITNQCPFAPRCELVKDECKKEIPKFTKEKNIHRCVIKGVKL